MPKSIHRPEYEVLRRLIREVRESAEVTQVELSERLGRSQSFVSDIERGVRRLDTLELRDLCEVLGADFMSVMGTFDSEASKLSGTRKRRGRASK